MNRRDRLDWDRYPQIITKIIQHASPPALRALRLTSPLIKQAVDKQTQSLYQIWGHQRTNPSYNRRTYILLASLASDEILLIEEFTRRHAPIGEPLLWRSPILRFNELNHATLRPHVFFVWPRLRNYYQDFDPGMLYHSSPLADLVRLVAATTVADQTQWAFVGPEEWDEHLPLQWPLQGTFFECFVDTVVRIRLGLSPAQPVGEAQRALLSRCVAATSRYCWVEWTRPELVNFVEVTQGMLLGQQQQQQQVWGYLPHYGFVGY